jgi:hypothetical protein
VESSERASETDLVPGTLDMLILKILSQESMHGYGVARSIQQISCDALRVEEDALYRGAASPGGPRPTRSKWGLSENNRRAKYYTLTAQPGGSSSARRHGGHALPLL